MPSVSDLRALLERVRAASGPDRSLDQDIYAALRPSALDEAWFWITAREYTASIDAALALVERVLPGAYGQVEFGGRKQGAHIYEEHHVGEPHFGLGCRPPLAIIATLLSALIAQKDVSDAD